ncbi:cbb3-type cytochrome c oxidase N-terminal domain-containing protein [Ferruginibacter sp.]
MKYINLIQKKFALTAIFLLLLTVAMAQDKAAATATAGYNQLAILLIIMTVVLAFVIYGLGQVLLVLSRQMLDKNKKENKTAAALIMVALLFISPACFATGDVATDAVKVLPNFGGLSATNFYMFVVVIAVEVIAILFLVFSIRRVYAELLPQKEMVPGKISLLKNWWVNIDKKIFTKAVPVEKEADVMLDHNYDGIQELDNALPPWWKYGFIITIVIACVYLLNFHVLGTGKNPTEEYVAEMQSAKKEIEIFESKNKDKVDESKVPMADAAGIAIGLQLFEANCVACHTKSGAGSQEPVSVGPNLVDEYWIHKGSLNDIYTTIKNGYPDKGMQAWNSKFNPKEISQLASYIKSIRGTKVPNAKLPQGEMYTESVAADSAATVKTGAALPKNATGVIVKDSAKQ